MVQSNADMPDIHFGDGTNFRLLSLPVMKPTLKGAARAKLSRTKEFDHSKWVGGGMLDYRFSNARRIVNEDVYKRQNQTSA